ncbi:MAG TPA: sigma-70 family RNA polymerase sigma factor [Longimicrobiaceae bacterium]|nr:sigma-70 family RNA polymerase sigma factor [Longimicrobiaceae bacterium]
MTIGDQEGSFLALVHANDSAIRKICRVYGDDRAAREDLYQNILVQLWRALPSFRGTSAPGTWLYRVALNTALAQRRRASARPETQLEDPDTFMGEHHHRPDREFEANQRLEKLYRAIDRLDDLDKALILLHLEDQSYREIAEVLDISESNVGVKLHRIRKKLATLLIEERP